ncbi:hypothetical protein [Kibdelosporangium aridum]|uniref:hypothetical protein n=1 Tax=Kibdelosporangium aridum TaxID=2030 RepID=UPI0035EEB718
MSIIGNVITAVVALLGVVIGGWLTVRNQERSWQREHSRQWRDIRLAAYNEFLAACRQYIAFTLEPTAKITAVPHPREPGQMMPFFDEAGRPYKEKLESAFTAVRLVSELPDTVRTVVTVVNRARQIAAARATHSEADLPSEPFKVLWSAEQEFLIAARLELGLSAMPRTPGN